MMKIAIDAMSGDLGSSIVVKAVQAFLKQFDDTELYVCGKKEELTELEGLDTDYFAFADIDPVFDYYTPVIISGNKFLQENPDTAKAFGVIQTLLQ